MGTPGLVSAMSDSSSHSTHQVLALAVGLGVGVPAVLAVLMIIFFTVRHRRLVREEDKRHEAIDLDREISFHAERVKRRHKPVPGSTTYLAKQHAASQRDLTVRELGSEDRLVMPPSKGVENSRGSLVSHESAYVPYAQEQQAAASAEDLTRDLGGFEAPKYPRALRSSPSSSSLARDEWSRRTSMSDSVASSPMIDRQKSQGHATVLKIYDEYQPRFEEQRRPSTLQEVDERRSPFELEDSGDETRDIDYDETQSQFSFEEAQEHQEPQFVSARDINEHVGVNKEAEAEQSFDQTYDESDEERHLEPGYVEPAREQESELSPEELKLQSEQAEPRASQKEMSAANRRSFVPVQHHQETERMSPERPAGRESSEYDHFAANPRTSSVYDQSVYEQPWGGNASANNGYSAYSTPDTSRSSAPMPPAHAPRTPQLDSNPLSPSTPLHSVPFSPAGRSHTPSSQGGSRRGSLSEYMPDVPMATPRSPRHGRKAQPGLDSSLDSSMFFDKPKKFGKSKGVVPSASQIAL